LHRRAEKTNHCGRNIGLRTGARIYGTFFPLVILSEAKDLGTFFQSGSTSPTGTPALSLFCKRKRLREIHAASSFSETVS
jgi:hypothetical protein